VKSLVLGCGMQGRAAVFDLARSPAVSAVTCADVAVDDVRAYLARLNSPKTAAVGVDVNDPAALRGLLGGGFDVVVDMLPSRFVPVVAEAAIAAGVHLVNTCYDNTIRHLAERAAAAGVAILPEMGLDPGIDLVLAAEAARRFERVRRLDSFGSGIPEAGADDNPLRYKISWTWEGVLNAYARPARLLREGRVIDVPSGEVFAPEHVELIDVPPFGLLESYPNGDAVAFAGKLGIAETVRTTGRYTLRWPGHCQIWRMFAQLGFLDESPIEALGGITPRQFMRRHLEPRLQYRAEERDAVILRVEAEGEGGRTPGVRFDLVDYKDRASGLSAMNRTVGFTASIAAQMIASGAIAGRGLLSPIRDVPYRPFVGALGERGIGIRENT
jgi:lysine 6-dehydrogenase